MAMVNILKLLLILTSIYFVQSAQVFDVLKFGAVADGVHKNTEAIAKAITAAHETPGGGTVNFPKGTYLTGPIVFKSNVHLHLEDGVVIKFSDDFDDYLPMVPVRFEGFLLKNFSPLIYAYNQTNFGITGKGILDGSGQKWWKYTKENFEHPYSQQKHIDVSSKWQLEFARQNAYLFAKYKGKLEIMWLFVFHFAKPDFFQPMYSQYITLEGVTFINSPFWTVAPTFSDHIVIHGVTVKNPRDQLNTDGIDPDSCRNVTISDCVVEVGDDCIAIKSGKDGQARELNYPTENVTITNFVCTGGYAGIAIGSEMSGSVRNIFIRNVTTTNVWNRLLFKTCRGRGGVIENVHVTDMVMTDHKATDFSINIYPFYKYGCIKNPDTKVSELTPTIRDIYITNLTASTRLGLTIVGLPEMPFKNIELRNVHLMGENPEVITDVDDLRLFNFTYHHLGK